MEEQWNCGSGVAGGSRVGDVLAQYCAGVNKVGDVWALAELSMGECSIVCGVGASKAEDE